MRISRILFFILGFTLLIGCKKDYSGDNNLRKTPETFFTVDTIIRDGENRFPSVVTLQWWGNDEDGFIVGYEVSFDQIDWTFTTRQDSTFRLNLPNNADTANIRIYIRAIDNDDLRDPSPATLVLPVKNSPPTVSFILPAASPSRNPVRSFPAVKFFFSGSDPDGEANFSHYEIALNDTNSTLIRIEKNITEITLVATDITANISSCNIFPGVSLNALNNQISGMILNDTNRLFIRAVDNVGAQSAFAESQKIYIRKPKSDILFINGQVSPFNKSQIQATYSAAISNAINKTFDTLQAAEIVNNNYTELSPDPLTQSRVFSFFNKIIWYGDNAEFNLSIGQRSLGDFFAKDGKIMIIVEGNDVMEEVPSYFDFTPIGSLLPLTNGRAFIFNSNDTLYPSNTNTNFPTLRTSNLLTGIRPFNLPSNNPSYNYQSLYNGKITLDDNGNISIWNGVSTLISKRTRLKDNKTDFIMVLLPLHRFNANNNLSTWFQRTLVNELEF